MSNLELEDGVNRGDLVDTRTPAELQTAFRAKYQSSLWGEGLRPHEDGSMRSFALFRFLMAPTDPEAVDDLREFITDANTVGYQAILNPVVLADRPGGIPIQHNSSVYFFLEGAPAQNLLTYGGTVESMQELQHAFRREHSGNLQHQGPMRRKGIDYYELIVEQTDYSALEFGDFMMGVLSAGYSKAMDTIVISAPPTRYHGKGVTEVPTSRILLYLKSGEEISEK